MTALQPGSGKLSHDGDDTYGSQVYEQVGVTGTAQQHEPSRARLGTGHSAAINEYHSFGVRQQPSIYSNVKDEAEDTDFHGVNKKPVFPTTMKSPVLVKGVDAQTPATPPHPIQHASAFVGNSKGVDLSRNSPAGRSVQISSPGIPVSQDPITSGFMTPSGVPLKFQEVNIQQIQILIDKLEALKGAGQGTKQPSTATSTEEEHLYEHIPESEREYPEKRGDESAATWPILPSKRLNPKHQHTEVGNADLKTQTATSKSKKSLGECFQLHVMYLLNDDAV